MNFKNIFKREFRISIENHKFHGIILAQTIFQLCIIYVLNWLWDSGPSDKSIVFFLGPLYMFPLFWISILAASYSSTMISRERENGMMELIKLSPISEKEFLGGKFVFCLIQYLIFAFIFLLMMGVYSASLGNLIIIISLVLVFGPYLILFILIVLLLLLISSVSKKNHFPVMFGTLITLASINGAMGLALFGPEYTGPIYHIRNDLNQIIIGSYPNVWIWLLIGISILIFTALLYISTEKLWKEVDE